MNKASGGDGIPVELFQILKDDAVKVLHSICQQIWKTAVATGREKVSFHSHPKKKQCQRIFKLPHASREMLKILHGRLQQYCTKNFQMFKLDLEKAGEPEIKFSTSTGSLKKQKDSRKTSTSASLATLKPLTVWITTNCGKFFKEIGIPNHLTCLLRNL